MVILPLLFLPPVFFRVFTNDFSGLLAVMSSNEVASLCLVPGVTGLNFFNAIVQKLYVAIKINYFTLCQRNDGFLIILLTARKYTCFCVASL